MEKKGIIVDIKPLHITVLTYEQKKYNLYRKKNFNYGDFITFTEKDIIKPKYIIMALIIFLIPLISLIIFFNKSSDNNTKSTNVINITSTKITTTPSVNTFDSDNSSVKVTSDSPSPSDSATLSESKSVTEKTKTSTSKKDNATKKTTENPTTNPDSESSIVPSTSTPIPQKTVISWNKKSNVAEYGDANWNNLIKKVSNVTIDEAKEIGEENSNITYFFYVKKRVTLADKGTFYPGDAVYFSGSPWYGNAPQADSYEKNVSVE
jgi:hypothetical protein